MAIIPADPHWQADGTPRSAAFDDVYHSAAGGPGQARQVFLAGNDLPARWRGRDRFVILETGFGTGLNFLATWAAWQADPARPARLHYLALEKHPFTRADLARLHAAWPEFAEPAAALRAAWPTLVPGQQRLALAGGAVQLTLILADGEAGLARLQAAVDAFYLDGFAPAKNPALWSPGVCRQLARLARPGATLATWSVAGAVRAALGAAGFETEKTPGFAGKREMLRGRYAGASNAADPAPVAAERHALIVGAGLAGSACAASLAARGWRVSLIERHAGPAQATSGNHAGVLLPRVSRDDNLASRLSRAAYLHTLRTWPHLNLGDAWQSGGVLQLARDAEDAERQRATVAALGFPAEYLDYLDPAEAAAWVGQPLPGGGWRFGQGGWAHPPAVCAAFLASAGARLRSHYGSGVADLIRRADAWQALDADGKLIAAAPVAILASGAEAASLAVSRALPIEPVRGQVNRVAAGGLPALSVCLCREGYLTPAWRGWHALGASYTPGLDDPDPHPADSLGNHERLRRLLPAANPPSPPTDWPARVGFRPVAPDRLPIVGALPDPDARLDTASSLDQIPRLPGLFGALAYASRGLVWTSLMAEQLASQISAEPLPLETDLGAAIDPARFMLRRARRQGGKR